MGQGKPLSGKKILIVEDNFLVSEDLQQLVRAADGEVAKSAASMGDALCALDDGEFDGALLDVQLQDGNCAEVARRLACKNIPFIVVTGYARDWLAPELRKAPYLSKPFDRKDLIDLAARHFRS
jgi:CheY-like chemotaxis protein